MFKIFGREPAVFFSLLASLVLAIVQFVDMPDALQGAVNALVLAGAGFATAATVSAERALPALVGLVQAVFAVFLAYGTPVPESTQTGILALISALASFFVRQNVFPPVTVALNSRLEAAYDNGYQAGQDEAVPTYTAKDTDSHLRAESGTHGLTEVLPAVKSPIYQEDTDDKR